jgi:hypothetical protein
MATDEQLYEAFTQLAQAYCTAIEDPSIQGLSGLRIIHDALLPIHAAAMQLPKVPTGQSVERAIEQDEAHAMLKALQLRLPVDIYWDTFDPLKDPSDNTVASSLADDLTDIWRDLKNGLIELNTHGKTEQPMVWWEWRFSFYCHWGAHSTGALRAMYHILRDSYE